MSYKVRAKYKEDDNKLKTDGHSCQKYLTEKQPTLPGFSNNGGYIDVRKV